MLDLGISKMALIGAVALIVIGPEKLPRVARTVGTLLGKAQRYVADVKAEVNRAMDLDELKKMKESVEQAGREVEQSIHKAQTDLNQSLRSTAAALEGHEDASSSAAASGPHNAAADVAEVWQAPPPEYRHPGKNWRLKRSAVPHWYKARAGVRRQAQSGAARVARYRPRKNT